MPSRSAIQTLERAPANTPFSIAQRHSPAPNIALNLSRQHSFEALKSKSWHSGVQHHKRALPTPPAQQNHPPHLNMLGLCAISLECHTSCFHPTPSSKSFPQWEGLQMVANGCKHPTSRTRKREPFATHSGNKEQLLLAFLVVVGCKTDADFFSLTDGDN